MSAFLSKKQSLLALLAGLCVSTAVALLLNYALAGPRLGFAYDFLLKCRPAPPVSGEILLVDTDEVVEPGDVFTVLVALSEMNASDLVVEVPVLGSASGRVESDEEIRRRINDEYSLLGRNIRNLFDAIRVGSVSPGESGAYVDNLVELTERGRDRLNAALTHRDGADTAQVAGAKAVFGSVLEAEDLRSQTDGDEGIRWYSRPMPDRDGKLRRIAPLLLPPAGDAPDSPPPPLEHIVYRTLKPRWEESALEYTERGPVLANRRIAAAAPAPATDGETAAAGESGASDGGADEASAAADSGAAVNTAINSGAVGANGIAEETRFYLDKNGNLLVEQPRKNDGFRRIALEKFREYEKADRAMRRLLHDAEALGVYSETAPERIPLILCDYAASLREELLKGSSPQAESRAAWANARSEYINSLDEFLYGPSEMNLVSGYEEIIATEDLNDDGIAKLQNFRDELIRAFVAMREQHRELVAARVLLAQALESSFCIMGPAPAADAGAGIRESSAYLANALLAGQSIAPGQSRYILFWSLAAVFAVLICIHLLRPAAVLASGLAASLLCMVGFGWSFVASSYWIDPQIPAAACLAGTLAVFTIRLLVSCRGARRFQAVYGAAVSKPCLAELVKAGRPSAVGVITVRAAVVAVKNPGLLNREAQGEPPLAARAAAEFHRDVSTAFKKAGAVILGCEGDTVLACFGSPPERVYLEQTNTETRYGDEANACSSHHPAAKAAGCVAELLQHAMPQPSEGGDSPVAAWRFGIDCGDCAFYWSEETGYTANGRPMVRARVLASLAARNRIQILVTDSVREQLNQLVRKIGALGSGGESGESFYELPV